MAGGKPELARRALAYLLLGYEPRPGSTLEDYVREADARLRAEVAREGEGRVEGA